MTPERWQQIEEIFNRVCEAPAEARAGLLDAEAGDDAELRAEVESLLLNTFGASGAIRGIVLKEAKHAEMPVGMHAGQMFAGRYSIERRAGAGGMGTVYRAADKHTGEAVALKVFHDTSTSSEHATRFFREAQLLASLRHPGIVGYSAHGVTPEGKFYLAMPWLDGEDLAQRLSRGALSLREAMMLVERVADALAGVHERGIIHRDLKPTNLFLPGGDVGKVQLLDFGIARRLTNTRAVTRTGTILGTPEYMAPEQARGVRAFTPAVDMFSLGCVLYECLAGEAPFVAPHVAAVLVRILFEEPTPIAERRPDVPVEVSAIVERLLRKDPNERWTNARELSAYIAGLGELESISHSKTLRDVRRPPTPRGVDVDSERVLLSLVLSLWPDGESEVFSEAAQDSPEVAPLIATLERMGVKVDLLVGGALVVTIASKHSAKDQASLAAMCAHAIKEYWPGAPVIVVTGRGVRSQGGLSGDVLDRAFRMLAMHGTPGATTSVVHVDEVSAGLLTGKFDLTPVPGQTGLFALGGASVDPDAERLLLGKPTPCVGREPELAALDGIYNQCRDEDLARAVLVVGQPGFGKSRLRQEFLRRLEMRGETPLLLLGRGDPLKMQSAYALLGDALRKQMELHAGIGLDELRERLRKRVTGGIPESEAMRVTVFLGELCGIPFPDEVDPMLRAARQNPRAMYDHIEAAWIDGLRLVQRKDPIILILEDLHWGDALTVRLLDATLKRMRDRALLVLALARPEVHEVHPNLWADSFTSIALRPLSRKASEKLVGQILGKDVDAGQQQWIVEEAAGNPLLLEELIRAAAEGKVSEIPETVLAMIQARIGHLPAQARRVLRACSVFGETFWENGIKRLLRVTHGAETIDGALLHLIREEIIEKTGDSTFAGETQYRFRHALVRDAAYGLINADEAGAWHVEAGRFLLDEGEFDARIAAEHFFRGQDMEQAAHFYARAAEQSYEAGDFEATTNAAQKSLACGLAGNERNALLGFYLVACFWRGMFEEILHHAPDVFEKMRPGSKPWCQSFLGLVAATISLSHPLFADVMERFLVCEPDPDALPGYMESAAVLSSTLAALVQLAPLRAVKDCLRRLRGFLPPTEAAWCWMHYEDAHSSFLVDGAVFHALKGYENAIHLASDLGLRHVGRGFICWYSLCLGRVGQYEQALAVLETCIGEQQHVKQELTTALNDVFLARQLMLRGNPGDMQRAEELVREHVTWKQLLVEGIARTELARVFHLRGDLSQAASEAEKAYQAMAPLPPYLIESCCLWAQILMDQGKAERSVELCKALDEQYTNLGVEPCGMVALLLRLAEGYARISCPEEARRAVSRGLAIVRRNVKDAPDAGFRESYLHHVPEHKRLFELARAWGIDDSDL